MCHRFADNSAFYGNITTKEAAENSEKKQMKSLSVIINRI